MCTKYRPETFSAFFCFSSFYFKKNFFCPSTQSNLAHLEDTFTINIFLPLLEKDLIHSVEIVKSLFCRPENTKNS